VFLEKISPHRTKLANEELQLVDCYSVDLFGWRAEGLMLKQMGRFASSAQPS
jgi:predicted nicotinamide N-methyase